jgi:hypothetical protein
MRTKPISETKTMTDFTTGQFIDAVTNIKDAFLNIKKENDDLIETNKYLVMEIKRLEADLLQMTLEKKEGKLVLREAKKEAEKKEKEAKKEVVEKKAIVEAIQIEETAAKKQSDQLLDGELSEEKEIVTKITFEGKDYLRDENNVVYDYNSQEEIGVWTGIMIELYDAELQHATLQISKMTNEIKFNNQYVLSRMEENKLIKISLIIQELKQIAPLLSDVELLQLYNKSISIHQGKFKGTEIFLKMIF